MISKLRRSLSSFKKQLSCKSYAKSLCVCLCVYAPRKQKKTFNVFTRFKTKKVQILKTYILRTVCNKSFSVTNKFSMELKLLLEEKLELLRIDIAWQKLQMFSRFGQVFKSKSMIKNKNERHDNEETCDKQPSCP